MEQVKVSWVKILTIGFLITGNLIGAGILALPVNTALGGLFPSLIVMLIVGAAMIYTALVLSNEAIERKCDRFHYPTLYGEYLGRYGKWVATFTNFFILYGLLTAYLTSSATTLDTLLPFNLPKPIYLITFFLAITALTLSGKGIVQKYNTIFILLLILCFAVIIGVSIPHMSFENASYVNLSMTPSTVPILVTSLHFHNLIPSVCRELHWDKKAIRKSIFTGMAIAMLMSGTWLVVSLSSLSLTTGEYSLATAYFENLPATVLLAKKVNFSLFITVSLIFTVIALLTSYVANGISLMGLLKNVTQHNNGLDHKYTRYALAFIPPLLISLFYPDIFLRTLNLVGGIGLITLSGVLPSTIEIVRKHTPMRRWIAVVMLILFLSFLTFELAQELGHSALPSTTEYWNIITHR